ncbi:MAG: PEGA domain-containing protein [Planctomycetota bacterium]|nr:PEGA domain-containing protein [Planctomycetota bacterium]
MDTGRALRVCMMFVVAFVFCGCVSQYQVTSDPTGAEVLLDGQAAGTTPMRVSFGEGSTKTVTIKKEGYEPQTRVLAPTGGMLQTSHFTLEQMAQAPTTFVKTMEPTWASVQIREGLAYENAWNSVMEVLVRKFDLEVLSKENGYMRTSWLYTWTGQMREDYRVRVTIKFSPEKDKVEVKSEANYNTKDGWVLGSDTSLLQTVKTDLMGTVGRITR